MSDLNLNKIAEGELYRQIQREYKRSINNIADPNTDPKKVRTVTITLKIHGDDRREMLFVEGDVKSKLVPSRAVATKMILGQHGDDLIARELVSSPGQYSFAEDGDIVDDVGEKVSEGKVVDLMSQSKAK